MKRKKRKVQPQNSFEADYKRKKLAGKQRTEEEKQLEKEFKKITTDAVTGFFSYAGGMRALKEARKGQKDGVLLYLSLDNLREINERNGIVFGDMILEEFGQIVRENTGNEDIRLRFNENSFCVWMPGAIRQTAAEITRNILKQLHRRLDPELFRIVFSAGIMAAGEDVHEKEMIQKAQMAKKEVLENGDKTVFGCYDELEDKNAQEPFWNGKQVSTAEYIKNANLVSLALMLFGKGSNFSAQMYLLLRKIGQHYGAEHVFLSGIQPDFHSVYVESRWHRRLPAEKEDQVVIVYDEQDWKQFSGDLAQGGFLAWNEKNPLSEDARVFCRAEVSEDGYAVPLYDNGSMMGILSVNGLGLQRNREEDKKNLLEIGSVIQSQISQQRHDLASKAKSDFLSRMSHEIRTPLNGIIGMAAIALAEDQTVEKMTDCLQKIQISSNYLLGLINDILDMSKIESGKMTLEAEDFSMLELSDMIQDLIGSQAEKKSIQFVCDIALKHEWFQADKLRISQVLINLLGNAVKFTKERGMVVLTIREEGSDEKTARLFFSVRDTGVGIRKEDQKRVFRSFEQTKSAARSGQNGTGLGLSISSRLVKLMGSEIKLESEPGTGSTFSFTLSVPLGEPHKEDEEEEKVFFDGYRVLVVEDVKLNAEIAEYILKEYHFEVDCVYDGAQAVQRMKETKPGTYDLILMDIMMPVMDGLDATKAIRGMEREDCKKIPIIAMSANAFDGDLKKSVECGMNGHLAKPVEVGKMYQVIKGVLEVSDRCKADCKDPI
jgi:diguanylate cyclase (GGDEF)-like protein